MIFLWYRGGIGDLVAVALVADFEDISEHLWNGFSYFTPTFALNQQVLATFPPIFPLHYGSFEAELVAHIVDYGV